MPAAGRTKIIADQPTGNQPLYPKLSQKTFLLLYLFTTNSVKLDSFLLFRWRYEPRIFYGNHLVVKHEQADATKNLAYSSLYNYRLIFADALHYRRF